jgi:hypothetical protein
MLLSKITFTVEASDPTDPTGLTEEDHERLMTNVMSLGGDNFNAELVAEVGRHHVGGGPKDAA